MSRAWLLTLAVAATGCAPHRVRHPVPAPMVDDAVVAGMPADIRYWGDTGAATLARSLSTALAQQRAALGVVDPALPLPPAAYLALSGGGADGAFGAGLVTGWTTHGDRPTFQVVTGISIGALIAPFAFLGPAYDAQLEAMSTTTSTDDVFAQRGTLSVYRGDAAGDSTPLQRLVATYVDAPLVAALAAAHAAGRRLLVGTTNLDEQRPVVWDLGAIATVGGVRALTLIRQVLLASAAIPGVFPPLYLPVEVGGQRYDEVHIDGSASASVFLAPPMLDLAAVNAAGGGPAERTLYVVRNTRVAPEYHRTEATLGSIGKQALLTMLKAQGVATLWMLYAQAERGGMRYRLAFVPDDVPVQAMAHEMFDQAAMTTLYHLGHTMSAAGYPWRAGPPGVELPGEAARLDGLAAPARATVAAP